GLRLADGARVWTYTEKQLRELDRPTELMPYTVLLGADEDFVYLSGSKVSALQKPGGMGSTAPFQTRWTRHVERPDSYPRALLTPDAVLVPGATERVAYDRKSGDPIPTVGGRWSPGQPGYLWAGEGMLFSLSGEGLTGFFDWQAQLERVRRL